MWIKNDIIEIYTTMPKEQILPMILTTAIVALFKVFVIAGVVLLIKLIIEKVKNKRER